MSAKSHGGHGRGGCQIRGHEKLHHEADKKLHGFTTLVRYAMYPSVVGK